VPVAAFDVHATPLVQLHVFAADTAKELHLEMIEEAS